MISILYQNLTKQFLQHPIFTYINLIVVALLFASSFQVNSVFFNPLVTAKQWGLEQCLLLLLVFYLISFLLTKIIYVTAIDVLVLIFCGWYFVNESLILAAPYTSTFQTIFIISIWGLIYLFIRLSTQRREMLIGIAVLWMVVLLLQSVLGLMQLYGLEKSYHGLFRVTGTFHNPGPFSGFIASGLPLSLGFLLYKVNLLGGSDNLKSQVSNNPQNHISTGKWLSKMSFNFVLRCVVQSLAWLSFAAIIMVLPPAQSRAAWVAAAAGSLYVIAGEPNFSTLVCSLKNRFVAINKPFRVVIAVIILLSVFAVSFGLYAMKRGSANGRLLMWQVTSQVIAEKPLTGHGTGAFNAIYMTEQANWFASGKGHNAQALVAGSPDAPFNELLKVWLEKGLIAVILVAGILYVIFFRKKDDEPDIKCPDADDKTRNTDNKLIVCFKGALISIIVFSLFSYPFDISSFVLQLIVLVAILAKSGKPILVVNGLKIKLLKLSVVILSVVSVTIFVPQRQAYYEAMKIWASAESFYNVRNYRLAVDAYEDAFPILKSYGLFLQMYGKALSMNQQYAKSNELLALAQQRYSSQIIQNTLGDNHKALGNYSEAEEAYTKSVYMIPSLLFPKYLLAKLYFESQQFDKAKLVAQEILDGQIKVESSATREILNEMKLLLHPMAID